MRTAIEVSSYHNSIVRRALDVARRDGLNGEDTMTYLAAQALMENDRLYGRLLRALDCVVSPPIMFVKPEDIR
jgi:hypothetical protein